MPKTITPRQQRFLFSKGSPLTKSERSTLRREIRRGEVKIRKKRKS